MKKISLFMMALLFSMMFSFVSCNKCSAPQDVVVEDTVEVVAVDSAELVVENLISMDRQAMYNKVGGDYRWYETCIQLNDFLDEENDGSLYEVVNVFQAIIDRDEGYDTKVYKFQHFANGVYAEDSTIGFWIEDFPMNDDAVQITYQEAYDNLMAVNMPKPHSRYVTLRKQVGPVEANPQYIFGNLYETVFVDAVTGEVRDYNPSFGKPEDGEGFKMPLGEWP